MSTSQAGDPAVRTLEHELELVRSAIAMVSSGGAPRILLTGLRFGDELVEPAQRMALEARVRVVPVWSTGEAGLDLTVEQVSHD